MNQSEVLEQALASIIELTKRVDELSERVEQLEKDLAWQQHDKELNNESE